MPESQDSSIPDPFWDDLFLACAFAAYVDQAVLQDGKPDPGLTRQRAYRYYEEALANKANPTAS